MKIFVIDNYDSFTYNLVHYLEELGAEVTVRRNDQFDLPEPNLMNTSCSPQAQVFQTRRDCSKPLSKNTPPPKKFLGCV